MNKVLLALLGAASLLGALPAHAAPAQDLSQMRAYFQHKYPNVKLKNYVYGVYAFDADAMSQYKNIMEFPPFDNVVDKGKKMWDTPFPNGKTYASCFPNGGKDVVGNYPYYDPKLKQVVDFEMALNQCRVKNGQKPYKLGDMKTLGVLDSYARTLSDGMLMNVKVDSPGARAAYQKGKDFFFRREGQMNFACATCHYLYAGQRLRSQTLSPFIGQATHWPVFRGGDKLFTLQKRFVGCQKKVRAAPYKIGSAQYADLEYFLSYMSNGLPLKADVFRQ